MPGDSSNAFVFVYPLDSTFGSVILPVSVCTVGKEVNTTNSRLFAGFFKNVLKLSFVVLDIVVGIGILIIVVGAAVFLLTGDYVISVGVAEVIVQPFCGIRCVWV